MNGTLPLLKAEGLGPDSKKLKMFEREGYLGEKRVYSKATHPPFTDRKLQGNDAQNAYVYVHTH